MTEWKNITEAYKKNIERLDSHLTSENWKSLNYLNLKNLSNEIRGLIKALNKNKRDFLEHHLLASTEKDKKNAGDFFTACDNKVNTYKSDLLEPLTEKISEVRDKRLYRRGIMYGAIIGILSSIMIQFAYDYMKKGITREAREKQIIELTESFESVIKENNANLLDSLKADETNKLEIKDIIIK